MTGELAALCTGLCWAVAARMFRILGANYSSLSLNFWKGLIATLALGSLMVFNQSYIQITPIQLFWLLMSGVIGIGIGDTFFFEAIKRVGDSTSILVAETFAPVFTAIFAVFWISEWLTLWQWLAIAAVLFTVDMVVKDEKHANSKHFNPSGYWFAGGAAICQALGAVISRDILTSSSIDIESAAFIRLLGGLVIVFCLMALKKKRLLPISENPKKTWLVMTTASIIGTLLAMYLQMLAFANTQAAVVQTLFASSVLWSLGVAYLYGERASKRAILWSITSMFGIAFLVVL